MFQRTGQGTIGIVLMVRSVQQPVAHLSQILIEPQRFARLRADRQQIDAMADQILHPSGRLTRGGHTDHQILTIGNPREVQLERSQKQCHETGVLRPGRLAQRGHQGRVQRIVNPGAPNTAHGGARVIQRQVQYRHIARELVQPIGPGRFGILGTRPFLFGAGIVDDAVRGVDHRRIARDDHLIQLRDIPHDHVDGPTVTNDVMGGDHQMVEVFALLLAQMHNIGAQEGAVFQVERRFHMAGQQGFQPRFARIRIQRGQIDQADLMRHLGVDAHGHPVR